MNNTYEKNDQPVPSRANATQRQGAKGISLPAMPVLQEQPLPPNENSQSVVQRVIGDAGETAIGKKAKKTNANRIAYEVKDAKIEEGKWQYELTLLPNLKQIWVNGDDEYDLVEEKIKVIKEGFISINKGDLKGGDIAGSGYSISIETGRIQLAHKDDEALKCFIKFTLDHDQKVGGVENIICRPYEGHGLGLLLVAVFLMHCQEEGMESITLLTQNTAPGFWAGFGLAQNKKTPINESKLVLNGPFRIKDPPVFQL